MGPPKTGTRTKEPVKTKTHKREKSYSNSAATDVSTSNSKRLRTVLQRHSGHRRASARGSSGWHERVSWRTRKYHAWNATSLRTSRERGREHASGLSVQSSPQVMHCTDAGRRRFGWCSGFELRDCSSIPGPWLVVMFSQC